MKRRMANKIENYKILPKRLINKYMSLSFEQCYFSVSIEFKGCVKVYVRDVWGRILIYSLNCRVSGGNFTLPSLGTVLDSLPSHGSSHLTLLFINLYSLLT